MDMIYRNVGTTGEQASIIGLGCEHLDDDIDRHGAGDSLFISLDEVAVLLSEITGSLPAAAAASGHLGAAELIEAVNIGAFGTLVQLPAVAAFRIVGKNGRKEFALLYTISSAILLIVFITMHIAAS